MIITIPGKKIKPLYILKSVGAVSPFATAWNGLYNLFWNKLKLEFIGNWLSCFGIVRANDDSVPRIGISGTNIIQSLLHHFLNKM